MTDYLDIDAAAYFDARASEATLYRKDVVVVARPASEGEEIFTVTHGGHEETRNTATADQMVVRNPGGEEYLIDTAKFESRYAFEEGEAPSGYKRYRAVGGPMPCVRLSENVSFTAPWGTPMRIQAGGVLVNGGPGDVYGIQPGEFSATYRRCNPDGVFI